MLHLKINLSLLLVDILQLNNRGQLVSEVPSKTYGPVSRIFISLIVNTTHLLPWISLK